MRRKPVISTVGISATSTQIKRAIKSSVGLSSLSMQLCLISVATQREMMLGMLINKHKPRSLLERYCFGFSLGILFLFGLVFLKGEGSLCWPNKRRSEVNLNHLKKLFKNHVYEML